MSHGDGVRQEKYPKGIPAPRTERTRENSWWSRRAAVGHPLIFDAFADIRGAGGYLLAVVRIFFGGRIEIVDA